MQQINENKKALENIGIMLICILSSFMFSIKSPLHIWSGYDCATDSSVFKTVALMMRKGYMPYRDSFDHKGPVIYIINYLGDCISREWGVWAIEFVFLAFFFFILYKTARLYCSIVPSFIVVFMSISLLFDYFEGGNLTEEYAMLFIAIAQYIFIDYFQNGRINRMRLIICGSSFAATLLLRPNMIAIWIVMCVAVLIKNIREKDTKKIQTFITYFFAGILIIILPIVIWLVTNDALVSFWQDYIAFNSRYTSGAGEQYALGNKWRCFFYYINTDIYIMALVAQIYKSWKEKNIYNYSYLLYMILTLVFVSISGRQYGHYAMTLVPVVVYPLSRIWGIIESIVNDNIREVLLVIAGIYIVSIYIAPKWIDLIQSIPTVYCTRNDESISQTVCGVLDDIGVDENNTISVYGNWDYIYVVSRRPHATRYSYQYPIGDVMPEILKQYFDELAEEAPKAIVVSDGYYDMEIKEFLANNGYDFVWGENADVDSGGALIFYKN